MGIKVKMELKEKKALLRRYKNWCVLRCAKSTSYEAKQKLITAASLFDEILEILETREEPLEVCGTKVGNDPTIWSCSRCHNPVYQGEIEEHRHPLGYCSNCGQSLIFPVRGRNRRLS